MKIKFKIKNEQLSVRVNLTKGMEIDQRELGFFYMKGFRGFLRPQMVKKNVMEYTGPMAIPLSARLEAPITRNDFYFILAQTMIAVRRLRQGNFLWNKVVWDIEHVYINAMTKEVQFIYIPLMGMQGTETGNVISFLHSVVACTRPAMGADTTFPMRFSQFLRGQNAFDPAKVEAFIKREEPAAVATAQKYWTGGSGFITDKKAEYWKHQDQVQRSAQQGWSQPNQPVNPGVWNQPNQPVNQGAWNRPNQPVNQPPVKLPTDQNWGNEASAGVLEATKLPTDQSWGDEAPTGVLAPTGLLDEKKTDLLYPTLYRVSTNETVPIKKKVFRVGKEQSYVDYFVANNNAVSRSHADIVTRENRFFVIDLNSTNKTYINGQMIPAQYETEIHNGDRLRLANEDFIFNSNV